MLRCWGKKRVEIGVENTQVLSCQTCIWVRLNDLLTTVWLWSLWLISKGGFAWYEWELHSMTCFMTRDISLIRIVSHSLSVCLSSEHQRIISIFKMWLSRSMFRPQGLLTLFYMIPYRIFMSNNVSCTPMRWMNFFFFNPLRILALISSKI